MNFRSRSSQILVTIAVSTALATALAGCGSASQGGSDGSSSAPPAADGTSNGSTAPVDVCGTMSVADASAASGQSFTSAKKLDTSNGDSICVYSGTSSEGNDTSWSIGVFACSADLFDQRLSSIGGPGKSNPVPGVGDSAYVSPVEILARFGDRCVEVGSAFNDAAFEDGYGSLAKATIAALK